MNNTTSNIYSKQMISIILQISSFDNVSHDAKPFRILHNSMVFWQDLLRTDFCWFLINQTLPFLHVDILGGGDNAFWFQVKIQQRCFRRIENYAMRFCKLLINFHNLL